MPYGDDSGLIGDENPRFMYFGPAPKAKANRRTRGRNHPRNTKNRVRPVQGYEPMGAFGVKDPIKVFADIIWKKMEKYLEKKFKDTEAKVLAEATKMADKFKAQIEKAVKDFTGQVNAEITKAIKGLETQLKSQFDAVSKNFQAELNKAINLIDKGLQARVQALSKTITDIMNQAVKDIQTKFVAEIQKIPGQIEATVRGEFGKLTPEMKNIMSAEVSKVMVEIQANAEKQMKEMPNIVADKVIAKMKESGIGAPMSAGPISPSAPSFALPAIRFQDDLGIDMDKHMAAIRKAFAQNGVAISDDESWDILQSLVSTMPRSVEDLIITLPKIDMAEA